MNPQCIETYYDVCVSGLKLLDVHFGTEIYSAETNRGRFLVKVLPLKVENVAQEGKVTEYLDLHGLKVAKFLRTKDGEYVAATSAFQFTVQEFIEGETLSVNCAPDWFLSESATFLGKTVRILREYPQLPLRFGKEFFSRQAMEAKKNDYLRELAATKLNGATENAALWEMQIRHLERISHFSIDTERLTYANSHGDYHIGQVIIQNGAICVVDWAAACRLPICLDVITSYVFAAPTCANGAIDAEGLKAYIRAFTAEMPLSPYDLRAMPYVLYVWHCMCNYRPDEYADLAESYRPIARLINALLDWLYDHVDVLSEALTE